MISEQSKATIETYNDNLQDNLTLLQLAVLLLLSQIRQNYIRKIIQIEILIL